MAKRDTIPTVIYNIARKARELKKALEHYEEPYCEITQNEKGVRVDVRLPAVKKRSIDLRMNSRKLEVRGENGRKNFYKIIDIPSIVDITRARAVYTKETLRVMLPYHRAL